jgi:hypothetical protein
VTEFVVLVELILIRQLENDSGVGPLRSREIHIRERMISEVMTSFADDVGLQIGVGHDLFQNGDQ